jgi:hypothetical protein
MYREVDREKAEPICAQIVNSAEAALPAKYRLMKEPDTER